MDHARTSKAPPGPVVVAIASALSVGCGQEGAAQPSSSPSPEPSAQAGGKAAVLEGAAVVLDVRTQAEHEAGHLANDLWIPVDELESRVGEVSAALHGDTSKKVVVYCRTGRRSARAKAVLEAHGFDHVVNGMGYDDLK